MQLPDLLLGTALWGWTVPKEICFQLLDQYYAAGYRQLDAATNYPINKTESDFRKSETILLEWIAAHGISDLQVIMKVGSLNNLGGPENNLSQAFLLLNLADYTEKLGTNLDTFMIHWDNRNDKEEIKASLQVLKQAQNQGLRVGLSGIKHPEVYAELNKTARLPFRIEIKHNVFQSAWSHYQTFQAEAEFLTYGINAGGLKLSRDYRTDSSSKVRNIDEKILEDKRERLEELVKTSGNNNRPPLSRFYQLGMLHAYYTPGVGGIIVGPSRPEQLHQSIEFHQLLSTTDYSDLYQKLKDLG
ncbi:MAG: hypothetical protein GYB31_12595 [Bacteroidetes bacterium]|nr:hypothetical protein [Bacteroidota bacterium]